jgi:hypothetical protein
LDCVLPLIFSPDVTDPQARSDLLTSLLSMTMVSRSHSPFRYTAPFAQRLVSSKGYSYTVGYARSFYGVCVVFWLEDLRVWLSLGLSLGKHEAVFLFSFFIFLGYLWMCFLFRALEACLGECWEESWRPGFPQPSDDVCRCRCVCSLSWSVGFDQYIDWGSDSCSFDPIYTSHHPSSIDHHLPSSVSSFVRRLLSTRLTSTCV